MGITKLRVIFMLLAFQWWSCYGCLEEESIALLQFKASVDHLYADSLSDWVEGRNCCNWTGVDCNNITGRVTQLQLDEIRKSIEWHMNASLFLPFKEIRSLSLSSNGIAGCVENEGFERLSVLANLEDLHLDGNYLDYTILLSLNAFSSLKSLRLGSNKIEGPISIEGLNYLTSLQYLSLGDNRIEGFKSFDGEEQILTKNLDILDLSNNLFDHSILSHLSSLSSLTLLDLRNNQLKGSINVTDLQALRNLDILYLSGNQINQFVASTGSEGLLQLSNLRKLDLSNNRFNNNIFSSLKELSSLESLALDNNLLKGAISMENLIFQFFSYIYLFSPKKKKISKPFGFIRQAALGNWSKLEGLSLNGNNITQIEGLRNSTSLKCIGLSYNNMKGAIFEQFLQNLSTLEELSFDYMSLLEKNIFEILGSLPSLKRLSLRGINASLTNESLSSLTNLKTLDLSYSNITNSFLILETIGRMHSLTSLRLSNCGLSGIIPTTTQGLCQLKNLEELYMNDNNLNGELPFCLTNLTSLSYLDLSNNNLYGRIPERMVNLSTLHYLDLSQNHFSGVLPYNFNIPFLEYFSLSENNLEGSFVHVFHKSFQLKTLDLSRNNFTDSIPSSIGLLSDLNFLLLSYNNLHGEIPIELCKLDRLSFIDLSNNNFSGHIQPCITVTTSPRMEALEWVFVFPRMKALEWVFISSTMEALERMFADQHPVLTAKNKSYTYHGTILRYIYGIDLSCNNLKGEIPREFGNLSIVKVLNLSHNRLTGEIPPTFSNLREIETLDLSFNNLNGSIPPQLTELNSLSSFSVAHNNLSGRTPERVAQFGTFEEVSYRDNPYLCGPPLLKSCSEDISPPSILENGDGSEAKDELIDMDAFKATFLASYPVTFLTVGVVLYINPQWRRASSHFVEQNICRCYYFMVNNILFLSKLRFS